MQVKQEINVYQFRDMFAHAGRQDNFSYEALGILFDYLENYQEDTGESFELDVIALCCDYSEMAWREVVDNYRIPGISVLDEDEAVEDVRAYLEDHTQVCGEFTNDDGETTFVFQAF